MTRFRSGCKNSRSICRSNTYLIQIHGYLRHWSPDDYVQEASKGPGERFYVTTRGCGRSIGTKRCTILACGIFYLPKNHNDEKNERHTAGGYRWKLKSV